MSTSKLPLYTIIPKPDGFHICLLFQGEPWPIPGFPSYSNLETAEMKVRLMEREDYEAWKIGSLARPDREYDEHGKVICHDETC